MNVRLYLQLCLFISVSCSLFAQQKANVRVVDSRSGNALAFATIKADQFYTLTNESGWAEIPTGAIYVISYIGYKGDTLELLKRTDSIIVSLELQQNLLATAVITGNREGERYIDAIAPLDIMPTAISQSRITPDLSNLMNRMPGVQVIDGQISIRGGAGYAYGAGSRVAMLLNNIPMIQADAGTISWSDLPIELLERIEIFKGAAATLYGSNALNGVVQMHTWPFLKDTSFTELVLASRAIGRPKDKVKQWYDPPRMSYWGHLLHKELKGKFQWQGSLRYEDEKTHLKDNFNKRFRATFMSKYQINKKTEVGIQTLVNKVDNSSFLYWENAREGAFIGDSSARIQSNILRIQADPYLKITNSKGNRHWLQARLFYSDNESLDNRGSALTQYLAQYQYAHNMWQGNGLWLNGVLGQAFNSDAELFGERKMWAYNAAVYSQYEHTFFEELKFSGGIRLEYNGQFPGTISFAGDSLNANEEELRPLFSAGLNYKASPSTSISLHYGEGYRFPTIAEKFVATALGPTTISPNPDLSSELGYSMNFSVKQAIKIGNFEALSRLDLFWMRYDDMIEFGLRDPNLGFQALNIGDTDIKGLEFSLMGESQWTSFQVQYLLSYTRLWPRYENFNEDIAARSSVDYNILKYRVRDQLTIQSQLIWKKWQLGISGLYNSDMEAIDQILELFIVDGLSAYRQEKKGEFFRWDLSIGYQAEQYGIMLDVQNIGNIEYSLRPALIEMPRNYNLQLELRF
jgi:iron complex outermembrane receptor protein